MNVLWLSWKDSEHPKAGGAEVVKSELCRRLVASGHHVIQLTSRFPGAENVKMIEGSKVIRVGGRLSVYIAAWNYYRRHLRGWADLVIDECNTIPFLASRYVSERNVVLIYQLAKEVWFYEAPAVASWIGYALEDYYMRSLRNRKVITISQSTKADLLRIKFKSENIKIIRVGCSIRTNQRVLTGAVRDPPTLLYFGSLRKMKRPEEVIRAFHLVKKSVSGLRLIIAGGGDARDNKRLKCLLSELNLGESVFFTGSVSPGRKIRLLRDADLIAVTSVKEGWGLVVTEAARLGTPAVVYDVDGLRDSVRDRETGLITGCSPQALAEGIIEMLTNRSLYSDCQRNAWNWSQELNFDNSYADFCSAAEIA